jgi:hypothetical protein
MLKVDVRVRLRRRQAAVPKQLLNTAQIRAGLEQMRCERMPQGVRTDVIKHAGARHRLVDGSAYRTNGQAPAVVIEKERWQRSLWRAFQQSMAGFQVTSQSFGSKASEWHEAFLLSFP